MARLERKEVTVENEEREDVLAQAAVPEVEQDDERDDEPDVEAHSAAC